MDNGYIDEDQLLGFLSKQLSIPYIDLKHFRFKAETVRLIPEIHPPLSGHSPRCQRR